MDKTPISTATSTLWPMQSCFGGLAIYDWDTWSFPECDYDASQITLPVATRHDNDVKKEDNRNDPNEKWQLSPKYTLTGTQGGDTCEHVVFQQCLRAASQAAVHKREFGGRPSLPQQQQQLLPRLEVGIMSDFVVEREASLLSTRAAQQKTFLIVMGVLATLGGLCRLCISSRRKR